MRLSKSIEGRVHKGLGVRKHLADLTELDEKLLSYEECKVNRELRTAEASY